MQTTRLSCGPQLSIVPAFKWKDRSHGQSLRWHILVEDSENEHIYHSEVGLGIRKRRQAYMMQGLSRKLWTLPSVPTLPANPLRNRC